MRNNTPLILFLFIFVLVSGTFAETEGISNQAEGMSLTDGSILSGTVLEHRIGEYVILADTEGNIRYLPEKTITSIHHPMESLPIESHSVFFLRNGLLIRGHLVRYSPAGELEISVTGDQLIPLTPDQVVKIVHIPAPIPDADSGYEAEGGLLKETAALKLEITIGRRKSARTSEAKKDDQRESLEEEISELEEDLTNGAEAAAAQAQKENRNEVASTAEEAAAAISELTALAASCEETGPTRTKGGSVQNNEKPSSLEVLKQAISAPSSLSELTIDELQQSTKISFAQLKQQAEAPAASIDSITYYREQAGTTAQIQKILRDRKRYGIFVRSRVSSLSRDLPEETRRSLYEANRLDNALNFSVRNLVPILNWGSWKQGDRLHAVITGVAELCIYAGTYAIAMSYLDSYSGSTELREVGGTWRTLTPAPSIVDAGFAVVGAAYLYSVARPFVFAHQQNTGLARSLNIETRGPQW